MKGRIAVFYDVDGTLVRSNIIHVYFYYTLRLPKLSDAFRKSLMLALFSPVYALTDMVNRSLFNKLFYKNYKSIPLERIRLMADELVREALLPNLYADARKRIEKAKEAGLVQVLVTGSIDTVMKPFADMLGIDHVIANQLEFENGHATGRLLPPVLAGKEKGQVMKEFAEEHNIDLSKSYAFADSKADLAMLEAVGFPCAVNPDDRLRKIAEESGWPVLKFR